MKERSEVKTEFDGGKNDGGRKRTRVRKSERTSEKKRKGRGEREREKAFYQACVGKSPSELVKISTQKSISSTSIVNKVVLVNTYRGVRVEERYYK